MFNLIISIIAIALVVVLAGASLYYGGEAFNRGSEDAKASTYVNQAQQVQAAATLFKATTGGNATSIQQLVDGKYMAGLPKVAVGADDPTVKWEIKADGTAVFVAQKIATSAKQGMTANICTTINKNGSGVVSCTDAAGLVVDSTAQTPVGDVAEGKTVTISMKL